MDHQSLSNVLGILRLIKANAKHKASIFLVKLAPDHSPPSQEIILRLAACLSEQIEAAATVIENSDLDEEFKPGAQQTLQGLRNAFALGALETAPMSHLRDIDNAISSFVILLRSASIETKPEVPEDAPELAKEVEELMKQFDDGALDPLVRSVAKKHLQTLATLLRHIPIFGLEAALTAYFELIVTLRRADVNTPKESKDALDPLFKEIDKWGGRLNNIDKAWNAGARWIGRAAKGIGLLAYFAS